MEARMNRITITVISAFLIFSTLGCGSRLACSKVDVSSYTPKRVNKCIELWQQGEPVYYATGSNGYEKGLEMADTWADYIIYNMEHSPVDFTKLREFMKGLVDGGPTPSGHRTPTVIAIVPVLGMDKETMMAGSWMVQQALAQGVHGVHLVRARDPEAIKTFVRAARYPVHKQEIDVLDEGLRGWGSHKFAAWVWGIDEMEYLKKADVWPLNPEGELILGIKIEDRHALENTEISVSIPGLAFAEHGPRDMGFSYGHLEGRADPPVPEEVNRAGDRVLAACKANGIYFLDNVLPDNVERQIDRGVMIGAGRREDSAEVGRAYTKRKMPW
jgi:4-hydroxy-2-oxoheptanedioate aldolase